MLASALLALGVLPAAASAQVQGRQVSGRVTRTLGDVAVVGATVVEVGGPGVAQTGIDGTFQIIVGAGDARLLIRAIGFQRRQINVPARESNVVVTLDEDPFKLEAVVVTGQATSIEKRNAPTSTVTVDTKALNNAPAQSIEQALQGKVPGAMIAMNSGAPGGGAQMQIRGVTSILGAGQPLFVVDGVIISNDAVSAGANSITSAGARTTAAGIGGSQDALVNRVADLNPQEIESIEVLKSGAATAMYARRGLRSMRAWAAAWRIGCSARASLRPCSRSAPCLTATRRARRIARCSPRYIRTAQFRSRTIIRRSYTTTARRRTR